MASIPWAKRWWKIALRTWDEIRADDVFGRSAQLAYYFFLALFPFLICVIASLSVFGVADRGRALLLDFLIRFLPLPAFQLVHRGSCGTAPSSGGDQRSNQKSAVPTAGTPTRKETP